MDIRQKMVKERRDILEKMDDATLAGSIRDYFSHNATMPGEGWLKKDGIQLAEYVENMKNEPGFEMDNLYAEEKRTAVLDKFSDVSVKSVRLKNPGLNEGMSAEDMPFPSEEEKLKGPTHYLIPGEINVTSVDPDKGAAAAKVFFGNGVMSADIPPQFLKNHPGVTGNVMIEAVDYSNGKGKNVTYDMYVDLMQGNEFDRILAQERFTPYMDSYIMTQFENKFAAYVPAMGNAPTMGGEMVRAMNRIGYRYLNDGVKLNDGYGRETVNPAARYLMAKGSDDVKDALEQMWAPYSGDYYSDEQYEMMLTELGNALLIQFDEQPDLFSTPNKEDMFDYADKYEDRDDSYDDEEEYYEEEEEDDYEDDYEDEEEYDDFADAVDSLGTEEGLEM